MGNINSLLTQDEINALLSGSVLSHDRPLSGRAKKKRYTNMSTVEVLKTIVSDIESEETYFDEDDEYEEYHAYELGKKTAIIAIEEVILELTPENNDRKTRGCIARPVSLDERIAMVKSRHESQKGVRS